MTTSGDVSREQAESRVIDRRKRLEEERKMRIFNAKQRTIGLDVQVVIRFHYAIQPNAKCQNRLWISKNWSVKQQKSSKKEEIKHLLIVY